MRKLLLLVLVLVASLTGVTSGAVDPLRVFIRSGPKSHGPGAHDYPRFLKEWVPLLNERGAKATGAEAFPTTAQLDRDRCAHPARAGSRQHRRCRPIART